jgi:PD-(D/E)XK endonuclease
VRIQYKAEHIGDGCVCFKTSITDARRPLEDGGYGGQIDAFAVYCPQIERVFRVPIEAVPTTIGARLRLDPCQERANMERQMASRLRTRYYQIRAERRGQDCALPLRHFRLTSRKDTKRGRAGQFLHGPLGDGKRIPTG